MIQVFDPVNFSVEENKFLLENIGKPTIVALQDIRAVPLAEPARGKGGAIKDKNPVNYPDGVNPAAVRPVLDRINELQELEAHNGEKWVGVEVLKAAIRVFLSENAKWERDHTRTCGKAPRWPSLYAFDSKGKPHLQGIGSDSGKIKTYFADDGSRRDFAVPLIQDTFEEYVPAWTKAASADDLGGKLFVDRDNNRIECKICGHTERFNVESRSSYGAARARISKHLRSAKTEVEAHREVHSTEFGS